MSTNQIIELADVSRVYRNGHDVVALSGVSLTISEGEHVAIVGASGSGKTTLLNILGCLDRPTLGRYILDGIDTGSLDDTDRTAIRAKLVGFVFQSYHLLGHRTVLENVLMGSLYHHEQAESRIDTALAAIDTVGLSHRVEFPARNLSGGERQRTAIARAVANEPRLLLCDEPTGNLDSASSSAVLDIIDRLVANGLTAIVITHDADVSARAHRCIRLVDGRVETT